MLPDENTPDYEEYDELPEDGPEEVLLPEKPSSSKTVMVPKVQSMNNYITKHYRAYIIQHLNECLVDGRISELAGVPVKSERILSEECCFRHYDYWRINRTDFWADIEVRLELKVQTEAGIDTDFFSFCVELWFSFADGDEECSFESIINASDREEVGDCWKLDKYLVPVLRRDEVDRYSEAIWTEYLPEAAKDGTKRRSGALAEKMGVKVYTIGVGTGARRTPRLLRDRYGRAVVRRYPSGFNEGQLKSIAEKTKGMYFPVNDRAALERALSDIDKLETTPLDADVWNRWQEHFEPLLTCGAALALLSVVFSMAAFRRMA